MNITTDYAIINPTQAIGTCTNNAMIALQTSLEAGDIKGSKFRKAIIGSIGAKKRGSFFTIDDDVAVIVEVSAPGNAFAKLLDVMVEAHEGEITQCLFITQTKGTAILRNQIKNPEKDVTGNRIEFDLAKETLTTYSEVFLHIPVGVIGVGFDQDD